MSLWIGDVHNVGIVSSPYTSLHSFECYVEKQQPPGPVLNASLG